MPASGSGNGASASRGLWVAGGTGLLGSQLVRFLRSGGHDVTAVSRSGGAVDDAEVRAVDVLDSAAVAKSARGAEGALLCTGLVSRDPNDSEAMHRAHVVGTRAALQGLRDAGVRRVVVASTSGTLAISENSDFIATEDSPGPQELALRFPYYRTKLYAEREALEANTSSFEVIVVNPSLLLGPGDLRESSTGDIRRYLEREIPAAPAGGIAFVDVRDVALGMWQAFERGQAGQRYLLNAKNMTVRAFFQRLERMTGVPAPRAQLPASRSLSLGAHALMSTFLEKMGGAMPVDAVSVEMGQLFWYCSSEKAERSLGFAPRDPGETLRDTVDDLISRGAAHPRPGLGLAKAAQKALDALRARSLG
ncbi:MAG TPA: NAD-dependent epimerase/dehydratase family protein [Polyangiaceae bacterium]|nr:NAD-dependent epimerase/dehydratase family protein [Polyangiaceae bacterium]